jgi:hypothetical protein
MADMEEMIEEAIPVDKPIEVQPSPIYPVFGVFLRQLAVVVGALTTLLSLTNRGDIRGLFNYIQDEQFLTAVTIAVGLASLLWGWFRELKVWKKLYTMANRVDNRIAIVLDRVKFL